jgi:NTP pyrophosphatase (non-canonical NTP hydrolase)
MALGLGGEAGEVLEAEMADSPNDVLLELGDVLHYSTAIAHRFGIELQGQRTDAPFLPLAVSKVQELIKKHIRDGSDPVAKGLPQALGEVYYAISEHAVSNNITLDAVREANYLKLIERYNSGRFQAGRAVAPTPVKEAA